MSKKTAVEQEPKQSKTLVEILTDQLPPPEEDLVPPLTRRQQLLLVGLSHMAVEVVAEYPRRHTLDFEALVDARFRESVQTGIRIEKDTGIKGGLADVPPVLLRLTWVM